jgi:predicted sulfurtransferase
MYNKLSAIEEIKDNLLLTWHKQLGVNGRVYLHPEGINAQLLVPERNVNHFERRVQFHLLT